MKVSDLKLNEPVEINGLTYKYQGVKKIRKINYGMIQQIVFERQDKDGYSYKYFDLNVGSKELKVTEGKIELK